MAVQTQAWSAVWQGGIEIEGNTTIAASVNSSLYYILSAVRADWPYGLSPGGLARDDYEGHSFWDCEASPCPPASLFYSLLPSLFSISDPPSGGAHPHCPPSLTLPLVLTLALALSAL